MREGITMPKPAVKPDSLIFFLAERYALYASDDQDLYRCRINHVPWPLQDVSELSEVQSTIATVAGLPEVGDGSVNFCGGPVDVGVWPLEKVAEYH